jgi:hypothetical protein
MESTSSSGWLQEFLPFCPAEFQNAKITAAVRGKPRSMKILLQNKRTLDFLEGTTEWTPDPEKARVFETGLEAILFCLNHHIENTQILGEFRDERINFTVPVTDLRGD